LRVLAMSTSVAARCMWMRPFVSLTAKLTEPARSFDHRIAGRILGLHVVSPAAGATPATARMHTRDTTRPRVLRVIMWLSLVGALGGFNGRPRCVRTEESE